MVIIGQARHRITIQAQGAPQQNELGEIVTPWDALISVWAAIEPQTGTEIVDQQQRTGYVLTRLRIRRRTDLTPAMRVLYGTKVLNILAILDANKPEWMVLYCREVI